MKKQLFISLFALVLASCAGSDTTKRQPQDTVVTMTTLPLIKDTVRKADSVRAKTVIIAWDSLFHEIHPKPVKISKADFDKYERDYKLSCKTDSTGFRSDLGLTLDNECLEICMATLIETATGNMMGLPSSYDEGMNGLLFSPSCDQFLVFSSYNYPESNEYNGRRGEVFGFTITGRGLNAIKPSFKYLAKDWLLEDLVWISEDEIATKTYDETQPGTQQRTYRYFRLELK